MPRQEDLFADTITNLKRTLQRRGDDSGTDDQITIPSNRGNKLKRKAKYVQEGHLSSGTAVKAYKRRIIYNGYQREIISKSASRVDADGDVVDPNLEYDSNDEVDDAYEDPYKDVKVENLLMPLTSAAALKDHPALSMAYTSKALDEMIQSAQDMIQREQHALSRMKRIFDGFRGDLSWVQVELFETDKDLVSLAAEHAAASTTSFLAARPDMVPDGAATQGGTTTGGLPAEICGQPVDARSEVHSIAVDEPDAHAFTQESKDASESRRIDGNGTAAGNNHMPPGSETGSGGADPTSHVGGVVSEEMQENENTKQEDLDETMELDEEDAQPAHRMTTRAKAQAAPSPTHSRDGSDDPEAGIHPMFALPEACLSSKNHGLEPREADETRRVISAYIQKQEDVVNSSWKLYTGLLRAKRLRDNVLEWCTAEGHVDEMSDGEDWCDLEKWGLVEGELEKGKEEEEEERTDGAKKTRNRRAAAAGAGDLVIRP